VPAAEFHEVVLPVLPDFGFYPGGDRLGSLRIAEFVDVFHIHSPRHLFHKA
jgi:hypothetical protein